MLRATSPLVPAVVHCLDVVPVRIEHERAVVAVRILGPRAWRSVVSPSSFERGRVESIDLLAPVRHKSDVNRRARPIRGRNCEVVCLLKAERNLLGAFSPRPDLGKPERRKRTTVELTTSGKIAHPNTDVVDHYTAPWHTPDSKSELARAPVNRNVAATSPSGSVQLFGPTADAVVAKPEPG